MQNGEVNTKTVQTRDRPERHEGESGTPAAGTIDGVS